MTERQYYASKGEKKTDNFLRHIAKGCVGTKSAAQQHLAGLMIVPQDMDVHDFMSLQHPANKTDIEDVVTHFDYHDLSGCLVKIDINGHEVPTMIKTLQNLSDCNPATIPLDDPQTLSMFQSTEAFGISQEELGTFTGTLGIPELETSFVRQILDDVQPAWFSDLIKL